MPYFNSFKKNISSHKKVNYLGIREIPLKKRIEIIILNHIARIFIIFVFRLKDTIFEKQYYC